MFLLFLAILQQVHCAKILGIVPTPFYSHQSVFQPLWQELSLREHQVTVITTNPLKNPSLTNLTEIDLSFTYKLVYEDHEGQNVLNGESNILLLMKYAFTIMHNMTSEQLKHKDVVKLLQSNSEFDVMIVEGHVMAWFGLVAKFKCPLIVVTSMSATNHMKKIMGNLNNPVWTHSFNLPFGPHPNFFQRILCVLFEIFDQIQMHFQFVVQEKIISKAMSEKINLYQIANNVSLLFTNEIPGFDKVSTKLPSIIQLNGLQIKPPTKLPDDLENFLNGAQNGAIYFSLGSNVKSYLMTTERRNIFLKAFQQLPFRVIWKFEEPLENVPENVKVVHWAPQQDILRHQNLKLFITQGGLQSIDEGIRFKVPLLALPFFGDQFYNARRLQDLGIGIFLDFKAIEVEELKQVILMSIKNETLLGNLAQLSDLMNEPLSSLDRAIWWVEYVIRNRGAPHLRSSLADIYFYQYYLFDVILFLLLFVFVASIVAFKFAKIMIKKYLKAKRKKE